MSSLSVFITAELWNLAYGNKPLFPLIQVPADLWAAMGITTTALVGSPLIKDVKEGREGASGDEDDKDSNKVLETVKNIALKRIGKDELLNKINKTDSNADADANIKADNNAGTNANSKTDGNNGAKKEQLQDLKTSDIGAIKDAVKIYSVGKILYNRNPEDACFSDMLNGEDEDDASHIDLGKVQMFYFTVIVILVYAAMAAHSLAYGVFDPDPAKATSVYPVLDSSMVALLGISNAGYLGKKAV